ncbi:MAG: ABC transporter ATP-binding protein [Eubacteriales bacterium]|nr:ABC transporter ATP-binding protein [Eubacteriales bacterium]
MENVVYIKNVSKIYELYDKPIDRLKESLSFKKKIYHKDFYALNNISFEVKKGESLGIIGVNGSGKSTILKIITGVLTESSGEVKINGKVSALLELGAGFNMEYTGLENIYMNGTMMGYQKKEMYQKLDSILQFADIGDFIYQPVKSYSSGMFVRLAFALSISVEPDILVVDEALSVGDIFFQAKCYQRMEELKKSGTTIIMVTHDMGSVMRYCDRTILLNKGEMIAEGLPGDMIDTYKKLLTTSNDKLKIDENSKVYGNGKATISSIEILDHNKEKTNVILKGEKFYIKEKIKINEKIINPIFTFTIKDKRGTDLTGTNTLYENVNTGIGNIDDEYICEFCQEMTLQGGEYLLSVSCTGYENNEYVIYHRMYDILQITVISNKNTVGIYDMYSTIEVSKK